MCIFVLRNCLKKCSVVYSSINEIMISYFHPVGNAELQIGFVINKMSPNNGQQRQSSQGRRWRAGMWKRLYRQPLRKQKNTRKRPLALVGWNFPWKTRFSTCRFGNDRLDARRDFRMVAGSTFEKKEGFKLRSIVRETRYLIWNPRRVQNRIIELPLLQKNHLFETPPPLPRSLEMSLEPEIHFNMSLPNLTWP